MPPKSSPICRDIEVSEHVGKNLYAKLVILTVDDDPNVPRIEGDLKRRYDERVRVLRVESGHAGLDLLHRL